jgi:hypothetical protein
MNALEVIPYKGYTINIYQDEDPGNPMTEWDNLGSIVAWHRNYDLCTLDVSTNGREQKDLHFPTPDDFKEWLTENPSIVLPLFLFDHSGISVSTSSAHYRMCDSAGWDWGQVGWVFCTKKKVRSEYGRRRISTKVLALAEEVMRSQVNDFDKYLTGQVYGYTIENHAGEDVESCWGFYLGDDDTLTTGYMIDECKSSINHDIERRWQERGNTRNLAVSGRM